MANHRTLQLSRLLLSLPVAASLFGATAVVAAPLILVTPGEQNTQSGENGCAATPCAGGHWLHYPELLQVALGTGYAVQNNGDGGAVLGCDATTVDVAGGDSFCKSSKYTASVAMGPDIVIIGPFGEHDQRIVGKSAQNQAALDNQATFEKAYEGLVQKYLAHTMKIYMMTPIDVPWGGTPTLPNDLIKDAMLPAALKVAKDHSLPVIDTYTAISGTPTLVTMYYGTDGQVTSAGQQKMAELIEAALAAPPMGGSGGMGGGGAGGTGGASAGSGGTGGVSAGGASAGMGGSVGGSVPAGAAGMLPAAGGNTSAGTGGSPGSAGTSFTAPTSSSSDASGCTLSGSRESGASGLALIALAVSALWRRRRAL